MLGENDRRLCLQMSYSVPNLDNSLMESSVEDELWSKEGSTLICKVGWFD